MASDKGAVLITGASRGIGRAAADLLAGRGYEVVGLSRTKPADGFPGEFVSADLADKPATLEALRSITARRSILHLVNNAGVVRVDSAAEAGDEDLDALMAVNVRAALHCIQAVLPAMREAGYGRIVNISSRAQLGKEGRMLYGATKAALYSMTRSLALELGRDGITVNCIAPGPIETEMFSGNTPEGSPGRAKMVAQIPAGRIGRPVEVAEAIAYFLSPNASFTNGQLLYVCGGLSAGTAAFG